MRILPQAGGDTPPEDPPRRPDGRLLVVGDALGEERPGLLDAPGIERGTEAGPEQEAAQGEEHALVIRAAPPLLRAGPEDAPEVAVRGQRPGRAVAEHPLQAAPHLLRAGVLHRFLPEDDLQLLAGGVDGPGELRDAAALARTSPELELRSEER